MITGSREHGARMIKTDFTQDNSLVALAVARGGKIYVLASNFAPDEPTKFRPHMIGKLGQEARFLEKEIQDIKRCMSEGKEGGRSEDASLVACKNRIKEGLRDPGRIEAIDFLAKGYDCLAKRTTLVECIEHASKGLNEPDSVRLANRMKEIVSAHGEALTVRVILKHLPFDGTARVATYVIDSRHSNACKLNKSTEPLVSAVPCGVDGEVDKTVHNARLKARREAERSGVDSLLSAGYKETLIKRLCTAMRDCDSGLREFAEQIIKEKNLMPSSNFAGIKTDFEVACGVYRNTFASTFYKDSQYGIDNLNSWQNVSLEGSKKVRSIEVHSGEASIDLEMEQNSVWLLILEKQDR
jgi:hypothetical protein